MTRQREIRIRILLGSVFYLGIILGIIFALNRRSDKTSIFTQAEVPEVVYFSETPDEVLKVSKELFPDLTSIRGESQHLAGFFSGAQATLAYDIQAIPLIERDSEIYFYPLYEDVVGFYMDRSRSKEIRTWKDLLDSKRKIRLVKREPEQRYLWMNIAYVLSGLLEKKATVRYLADKFASGELTEKETPEVDILFYSHTINRSDANRQFVIPEDMVAIFRLGLLSHRPLPESTVKALRDVYRDLGFLPLREESGRKVKNGVYLVEEIPKEVYRFGSIQTELVRDIFQKRKYAPTNGVEHHAVSLLLSILISLGISYVYKTVVHVGVGKGLKVIGLSLIGFMMVTVIKYTYDGSYLINRAMWYGYYFFILLLPPATLYISVNVHRGDKEVFPKWLKVTEIFSFLLLLLVITNDYHQFTFRFLVEDQRLWTTNYTRNWGYYLVVVWLLVTQAGTWGYLVWKSWESPKRRWVFLPILVVCLGILYVAMYNLKVPFFHEISLALATAGFGLLFWGSVLLNDLVPRNCGYKELFENSKLQMEIYGNDNTLRFCSASTGHASKLLTEQEDTTKEDILVWSTDISGGKIVTKESISELNHLKKNLEDVISRLEKENQILKEREKVKSRLIFVKEQNGLTEYVNVVVENKIRKMMSLLERISKTPEEETQDLIQLQRIAFYCKRRCELLIKSKQKELCEKSTVCRLIDEVNEVSSEEYCFFYGLEEEISFDLAVEIYECYHLFCELAVEEKIRAMTSRLLKEAKEKGICLYFLAEGNGERLYQKIAQSLRSSKVTGYKNMGDAFSLIIHLQEGVSNDRFV